MLSSGRFITVYILGSDLLQINFSIWCEVGVQDFPLDGYPINSEAFTDKTHLSLVNCSGASFINHVTLQNLIFTNVPVLKRTLAIIVVLL